MDNQFKKDLKARAHHLKPVILIGQHGLTATVLEEIARALYDHELIKIRIAGQDREERKAMAQEICATQKAELVQTIGNVLVIYKPSEKAS